MIEIEDGATYYRDIYFLSKKKTRNRQPIPRNNSKHL